MDCCPPRRSLKSITDIYHHLMESAENGAVLAIPHSDTARRKQLRPGTQGGPVYPAVLPDPGVPYAASGIASWRASTTSDCPSTETATWPPD
ncbi:hypothetical protein NicSoilB4_15120 [Arthrobacter sp. NicSoilB4]|nr:hypothetical protein NicSoilB4_15120 [Arthrobacter sp. NicSoilB4]